MRQIHVCAWLLLMTAAMVACSGEKFTGADKSGDSAAAGPVLGAAASGSYSPGVSSSGGSSQSGSSSQSPNDAVPPAMAGTVNTALGGSASVGGADVSGGAGGDSAEACPSGTITFRMLPGPDLAHDFLCDASCGTGWLTITDAEGATAFPIFSACGTASCESCEMLSCAAAACLPTPLTTEGSEYVWTGTYLAKDTCGANVACQRSACVKPGRYKAKACAAVNGGSAQNGAGCSPKNEQICTETEFDFPATATVKLVLKKP